MIFSIADTMRIAGIQDDFELNGFQVMLDIGENNLWHDHETVLEHTRKVLLQIRLLCLTEFDQKLIKSSNLTRADLLALVAVLHDVGKYNVMQYLPDGTTAAPNHAAIGTVIAKSILSKSWLDNVEIDYVLKLISMHHDNIEGVPHDDMWSDFLVLRLADICSCEVRPEVWMERYEKIDCYYGLLQEFLKRV